MKLRHRRRLTLLSLLPLLAAAPAARADDSTPSESKNEIVVFGGYSILDATRGTERSVSFPDGGGFIPPIFPDRPPGIFPPVSIQIQTGTSLGGSALFGFRYSRAIKKRLWVEADFEVGPSHHLETSRGVCVEGVRCFGTVDLDRVGGRRFFPDLDFDLGGTRQVTAWNYGAGLAYELTGGDVRRALEAPVGRIISAVKDTLERTPPELAADLGVRGIVMAGGGSLLRGVDERLRSEVGLPVQLVESPLTCVAEGAGRSLDELETLDRAAKAQRKVRGRR
jgi:hypothetical protein